jgi:hypothetical protein
VRHGYHVMKKYWGRPSKDLHFIDVGTKHRELTHVPAALSSRNESSTFNG